METSLAHPWALVKYAQVNGYAPRTRIMFLQRANVIKPHGIVSFTGFYHPGNGFCREVDPNDVLRQWRDKPDNRTVRAARKVLSDAARAARNLAKGA